MNSASINLRPASPVLDDGRAYASYLDIAAEGFFRFMLGREATEIVAEAYLQTGHHYSYENVLFAEREEQIIGMASGFGADRHRTFSDEPLKRAAGRHLFRLMAVKTIFAPVIRALNTLADGDFYLVSVAIDEEFRGSGVGSALMDAMEVRAVTDGCRRLALDVSADNDGARRLYERRGMTVESRWPRHLVIPGVRFYRMTKTL